MWCGDGGKGCVCRGGVDEDEVVVVVAVVEDLRWATNVLEVT